ncbi:hypothetical protein [Thalassomonas sp. M1454]|uniref:hypothetical protein n=1 Tax=Thalassomonas sp. M1454 TaxID=2594477 RepID=UPI00117F2B52|nr:hypothetical protein [Thalassomonas sp. M1454]TRX54981.1 hypothetical protein FNN08_10275 [Thalassomonas sp. M1454]
MPTQLTKQTGYVVAVKKIKSRYSDSLEFELSNQKVFVYDGILPNLNTVYKALSNAQQASVYLSANEIWQLDVDGHIILPPESALKARQENGQYGLILALMLLLIAVILVFVAIKHQRST